ncbi:unnamed protein product, partial [Urochloa humidicola]
RPVSLSLSQVSSLSSLSPPAVPPRRRTTSLPSHLAAAPPPPSLPPSMAPLSAYSSPTFLPSTEMEGARARRDPDPWPLPRSSSPSPRGRPTSPSSCPPSPSSSHLRFRLAQPSSQASRRPWRMRSTRCTTRRSPSTARMSTCPRPATRLPRSRSAPLRPAELDEMKCRLKVMEEEAAALREMQAKVAKEMQDGEGIGLSTCFAG